MANLPVMTLFSLSRRALPILVSPYLGKKSGFLKFSKTLYRSHATVS
jgi:hypothetical protein